MLRQLQPTLIPIKLLLHCNYRLHEFPLDQLGIQQAGNTQKTQNCCHLKENNKVQQWLYNFGKKKV